MNSPEKPFERLERRKEVSRLYLENYSQWKIAITLFIGSRTER